MNHRILFSRLLLSSHAVLNLWQAEDATSTVEVPLERGPITVELRGRHSEMFHCEGSNVKRM